VSNLEALLLGVVQGLTEFLPISSSGHLILVPWLQDYTFLIENDQFNKTFDVALHAGTLIAAIVYFRREVVRLIAGRAHVAADARCNKVGGFRVLRVQIDRVALLKGSSVLKQAGPFSNGSNNVTGQTAGNGSIPCTMNLRVYVHFSERSIDGSLGEGGFYGPYFRRPC